MIPLNRSQIHRHRQRILNPLRVFRFEPERFHGRRRHANHITKRDHSRHGSLGGFSEEIHGFGSGNARTDCQAHGFCDFCTSKTEFCSDLSCAFGQSRGKVLRLFPRQQGKDSRHLVLESRSVRRADSEGPCDCRAKDPRALGDFPGNVADGFEGFPRLLRLRANRFRELGECVLRLFGRKNKLPGFAIDFDEQAQIGHGLFLTDLRQE